MILPILEEFRVENFINTFFNNIYSFIYIFKLKFGSKHLFSFLTQQTLKMKHINPFFPSYFLSLAIFLPIHFFPPSYRTQNPKPNYSSLRRLLIE